MTEEEAPSPETRGPPRLESSGPRRRVTVAVCARDSCQSGMDSVACVQGLEDGSFGGHGLGTVLPVSSADRLVPALIGAAQSCGSRELRVTARERRVRTYSVVAHLLSRGASGFGLFASPPLVTPGPV